MSAKSNPPSARLVIWGVVALVVVGVLIWRASRPDENMNSVTSDSAVGKTMTQIELEPLTGDGKSVSAETIRGHVVLMNYWDTHCDICMREFPHLVELWDRYRDRPEMLFLSVSASGDAAENLPRLKQQTEEFLKLKGVSIPTYADANGKTQDALAKLFGVEEIAYPATVIVDRQGVIRAVWRGYAAGDERTMEQMLSKLLAEK